MSYIRRKKVGNHTYIYEVEKVREGQGWRQEVVRYIGPEDPVYGNRGPVDLASKRRKLAKRLERKPADD